MTEFVYRVLDQNGQAMTGVIEASDRAAAAAELQSRGQTPVEISSQGKTLSIILNSEFSFFGAPSQRDVCSFLRDLSRLLNAGLSVDASLKLLLDMQTRKPFANIISAVHDDIRKGESLASAMSRHPLFSVQITAAVHAGENAGELPEALESLASSMDRALSFKEKLRSALIYPSFLLSMVVLTFVLVMTFVLPQFEPLFEGNEDKLPWATNFVMGLANFFEANAMVLTLTGAAVLTFAVISWRDAASRGKLLSGLCRYRPIGNWLETPDVVRFIRTLGVCSESGMPLDKALSMAIRSVQLPHIADACAKARQSVRRGESVSSSFQRLTWFPALALQFAMVGEQSGKLGVMLEEASTILAQDYEAKLEKALEVLSPVLTLVLGAIVALLVGSVLIGIMSINDVAF